MAGDAISKKVDVYIENSAEFARPILAHLRSLVHRGCPGVAEEIKWRSPCFVYQGLLCGMAAFKHHVSLGFWKAKLMADPDGLLGENPARSMCGLKFASLDDLPPDRVLLKYVREARRLNEEGIRLPRTPRGKGVVEIHPEFAGALRRSAAARRVFEAFSPSCQREYAEWISEAKKPATRERRIAQALEMLAEGKSRNWKYETRSAR